MDAFSLSSILKLLLLACLIGIGMRWRNQSYTISLVLIGLLGAATQIIPPVSLTHFVAFYLILPPILFQGGLNLKLEHLRKDWLLIAFLAVPGVIVSTVLVGYPLAYFWHIPLTYALLFGALIAPTDPVSVLAILKKIKAPDRLRTVLEAESLFNDGTGVVLFAIILSMIQSNQPLNVSHALVQFLIVAGGGALVGALCGFVITALMKPLQDHLLQVVLTVILTFGTPLLADALHCSGLIAVIVAGLVMGKTRMSLPVKNRETIESFWETIDFIMNSLVFLIIGLQLQIIGTHNLIELKNFILIGIFIVLLSRIFIVYPSVFFHNLFPQLPLPSSWNHILFWGGLRGTIPMLLALQLP
ncbi:MAG: sodium:proton antiporter, partial [Candidatus Omnitrophota bacterium]